MEGKKIMEVIRETASRTQLGPQEFISGRFILGRSHISGEWLLPVFRVVPPGPDRKSIKLIGSGLEWRFLSRGRNIIRTKELELL